MISRAIPLPGSDDTIVALATAPGRSALALVRISGPRAHAIVRALTDPWPARARVATLSRINGPQENSQLLDRGVITRYDAPHSYTGEDLVELTIHGGFIVAGTVIEALIHCGAREATAGEFTRRAVLNGKMDIVQAEAVADLIDARSRRAQSLALVQLDGSLSRRIETLRTQVLEIEGLIAYDIDFPEEDDGPVPTQRILAACDAVVDSLVELRQTSRVSELIRDGVLVVLAGAPNVGKSLLFNALLGQTRAIVTDVPGTTRDALEVVLDVDGWAIRLVDTAGLRATSEEVERLGIEMSERYLDDAGIILACGDSDESLTAVLARISPRMAAGSIIGVRTKWDLGPGNGRGDDLVSRGYQSQALQAEPLPIVPVSSRTREGLELLLGMISDRLVSSHRPESLNAPILTRARHARAIDEARQAIEEFRAAWIEGGLPPSVAATHLRTATLALEELIGSVKIDDILDHVFSSFCIGK